jgi:hypothetical protein
VLVKILLGCGDYPYPGSSIFRDGVLTVPLRTERGNVSMQRLQADTQASILDRSTVATGDLELLRSLPRQIVQNLTAVPGFADSFSCQLSSWPATPDLDRWNYPHDELLIGEYR